jgi:hypothetical protein
MTGFRQVGWKKIPRGLHLIIATTAIRIFPIGVGLVVSRTVLEKIGIHIDGVCTLRGIIFKRPHR